MLRVFLAALILVGFGVFAMCFNILFRKKDFPHSDVGDNEEMRKRGIRCMKEIDDDIFVKGKGKKSPAGCSGNYSGDCIGCSFFPKKDN